MMFQNFYPNKLIRSVYELNWEELSRTYGGVIFDIDNTLVPSSVHRLSGLIYSDKNSETSFKVSFDW